MKGGLKEGKKNLEKAYQGENQEASPEPSPMAKQEGALPENKSVKWKKKADSDSQKVRDSSEEADEETAREKKWKVTEIVSKTILPDSEGGIFAAILAVLFVLYGGLREYLKNRKTG